jgi:hypothetical protein
MGCCAVLLLGCWREASPTPSNTVPTEQPPSPARWTLPRPEPVEWPTTFAPSNVAVAAASPGPLSQSHVALDATTGCAGCHESAGPQVTTTDTRCLGCHDALVAGTGLHTLPELSGKRCVTCHSEHKSRSYDLMGWKSQPGGAQQFDHARAGWPLPAKYQSLACNQCHSTTNRQGLRIFRGLNRRDF